MQVHRETKCYVVNLWQFQCDAGSYCFGPTPAFSYLVIRNSPMGSGSLISKGLVAPPLVRGGGGTLASPVIHLGLSTATRDCKEPFRRANPSWHCECDICMTQLEAAARRRLFLSILWHWLPPLHWRHLRFLWVLIGIHTNCC